MCNWWSFGVLLLQSAYDAVFSGLSRLHTDGQEPRTGKELHETDDGDMAQEQVGNSYMLLFL